MKEIEDCFLEQEAKKKLDEKPRRSFSRRQFKFHDFDHPEYKDLVSINEELFASEMNGFQRTNKFLVRLYPNKKFILDREPLVEPSVELVWLL